MNELQMKVFSPKQLSQLKKVKPDINCQGFFYVVEYGDYIKIGSSIYPYNRYRSFVGEARYGQKKIGRIAISCSHTNFRQNEHKLHKQYSEYRIEGTELFKLPFKKVVKECWRLVLYNFSDNSKKMDGFLEWAKETLWKDNTQKNKRINALLTALVANCPLLGIGSYDESLIIEDLKLAEENNKQIKNCLLELGYLTVIPFLKECRQWVDRPQNLALREHVIKTGEKMADFNIEIPIEKAITVMKEGGIYDFS